MYPSILYVKEVVISSLPSCPSNSTGILPKFTMDKTKCKVKNILKDELGNILGSDVSNKVFRIKIGSVE
jgi:hypothetical protein